MLRTLMLLATVVGAYAEVCGGTNLGQYCGAPEASSGDTSRSGSFEEMCANPDIPKLNFELGDNSAKPCCQPSLGSCPHENYDSFLEQCEEFCAKGKELTGVVVPVVVGGEAFGVGIKDATRLCLDPQIIGNGTGFSRDLEDRCSNNANAVQGIENAAIGLLRTMRIFTYAVLHYKTGILGQIDDIKKAMKDPVQLGLINSANPDEKIDVVIKLYREALKAGANPGKVVLQERIQDLREAAANLQSAMELETKKLADFLDECNGFSPKPDTFLQDVCTKTGSECIGKEESVHVSCCCYENRIVQMILGGDFAAPPSPAPELRQLSSDVDSPGPRDMCAQMHQESAEVVQAERADIKSMPHGAKLLNEYESSLKNRYGKFYAGDFPSNEEEPCFSREAEACRILDSAASPTDAYRACFDEPALKWAERVKMAELSGGDYVLSAGKDLTYEVARIIVNQHRVEGQKRSAIVKITHSTGELSLTPDHVLLVDGEWAAARTVKIGSSLSGSNVTAVSSAFAGVVNPLTTSGMIVAAGPIGGAVVASTYPEWIASYMLDVTVYPLPISVGNLLAYLFPASVQAYYDQVLEDAFAANQARLGACKLGLPTVLVAPVIFSLDLLCAAGFVLYSLASPKALAALAAVAVIARAHHGKA